MKLIFMGTPDFAVPTLRALHAAGHDIVAVYTQPPRPAGRGKREQKSSVHKVAEELGLHVETPLSMKTPDAHEQFASLDAACAVVVAYGQILPQQILDAPTFGCINVHASLLPRWRGAAPIHRAIMAGDAETGVCIMQMEAGLDTGPVIVSAATDISADDTTATLHDRLADMGAGLINGAIDLIADGDLVVAEPQPDAGVTYARKIDKAEAEINWSLSADEIDRMVRGLFLFPGAWSIVEGERVKILAGRADMSTNHDAVAGAVVSDTLTVACGKGVYHIEKAQRAGKSVMDKDTFLRGFPVSKGAVLGGQVDEAL
ncbi:methionyl-tRNA formyltransferase [Kordiimonas aquimaris]|uniref:methionyl-tRNA formyltransferase n=1 Tax=Kordiimonas aquimaris TaxID=707591 RepID=UPI0021D2BE3E|nr:methionyl-tRNA formyltransferase [Kordiimonas aquimaris]